MLSSEIKKLEKPQDCAKYFRKRMNAFTIFTSNLAQPYQEIVIGLVYNLLKENSRTASGYFFKKLLEERNISYSDLAKYICAYQDFNPEYFSDIISLENVKSSLQKMVNSQKVKDNYLIELICDYFSIDTDLMIYGVGKRFEMNEENIVKAFDKTEINDIADKIENPPSVLLGKELEKARCYYKKFICNSPKLYTELLKSYCKQEIPLLKSEEDCLWDLEYFQIMIGKLTLKEQYAVFNLIEQLAKL